ncbi:hypothetical protein [Streptomyces sp. HF10]|uniref:hypothetical protein n=1 Tax=Streptomyces sp. HF10 TaxID=2692233 RepID=UPI0019162F25|nr:hypothetical protein [Streptomyces sp. HF10]
MVFTVIAAGVAMANLDVFIVNVALPDIGRQFSGTSLASLSWVLNAYAVVFAALLVPAGNFADRVNPRVAYLSGTCCSRSPRCCARCRRGSGSWSGRGCCRRSARRC